MAAPLSVIEFYDPFSVILDLPRNPNGFAWIHPGRNVSEAMMPPPEVYLESVDYVIVPRRPSDSKDFLLELYGPYIERSFSTLGQSEFWELYQRR